MARPTTAQLAALLTAWRNGSELLDTLGPRTDALLAQLVSAPKPVVECQPIDTAQMTDSELRAHYAKTAHVEDIRFHLRLSVGRDDQRAWTELAQQVEIDQRGKATTASKAQYWALCQAARERRLADDYTAKERFRAARIARKLAARRAQLTQAA